MDVVLQVLSRWPEPQRFPRMFPWSRLLTWADIEILAVIDLLRLIVFFYPCPLYAPANANTQILETVLAACHWNDYLSTDQPPSTSRETNVLLALRALANVFEIGGPGSVYGGGDWTALVRALPPGLTTLDS